VVNKKEVDDLDKIHYLKIFVKDYSDIRTRLYPYPNRNVLEENMKKQYYRIKDIKLVAFRLRLFVMFLNKTKCLKNYIFYFQYPNLSYFICAFLMIFTFFFDINNVPFYAIFGAILFLILTRHYKGKCFVANNFRFFSTI